jgi:hypothetical protein
MFARATRHAICALAFLGLVVSGAHADLPLDQNVFYKIHDDPNDPNSDVVFSVELTLTATARDGDSVGWEIKVMKFRQVEPGGPDTIWKIFNPAIPSADGRWWIDHADGDSPQLGEFDDPPRLAGTATAEDQYDDDLEYNFKGSEGTGATPWDPTARLNYEFMMVGASEPLLSATGDPVEVDDEGDPDS